MTLRWLIFMVCALSLPVWAQEDPADGLESVGKERTRIEAMRAESQATLLAQERDCQNRFAVAACVRDVTSRRNALLAEYKRQENSLNNAERLKRGADQLKRAEDKITKRALADQVVLDTPNTVQSDKEQAQQEKNLKHQQARGQVAESDKKQAKDAGLTDAEINENRLAYARKLADANERLLKRKERLREPATASLPALP
jgi:hypothetical protein